MKAFEEFVVSMCMLPKLSLRNTTDPSQYIWMAPSHCIRVNKRDWSKRSTLDQMRLPATPGSKLAKLVKEEIRNMKELKKIRVYIKEGYGSRVNNSSARVTFSQNVNVKKTTYAL